ncbi:hypothetical protein K501DRAFT_334726, partial [Backusella circina FSU 941]
MSNEEKGTNEQQHQSHLVHQELNFSINDILNQNHDENDSSFQSIVQTLSNNNGEDNTQSNYNNLPAELQQLFNSSSTEELLSPQNSNTDASMLQMWNRQPDLLGPQPSFMSSPQTATNSTPPSQQSQAQQSMSPQQLSNQSSPYSQSVSAAASSPNQTPTTLLDNIISQLPEDKRETFIHLFRELQSNAVTADQFLSQAKTLLEEQQYQQLEDLKNKPTSLVPKPDNDISRKRPISSSQIRAEDAQRSMTGLAFRIPQMKRLKNDHIPSNNMMNASNQGLMTSYQQLQPQNQQMQGFQSPSPQQQMQHLSPQPHHQQQPQLPHTPQSQTPQQQPLQILQHPQMPQQQQPIQAVSQQMVQTPVVPQIQQPNGPVFKTPAVPGTPNLQVPRTNSPQTTSTKPAAASTGSAPAGGERTDYDMLTDVMGYAGVDLKEEAEHFTKDGDAPSGSLPDGVDRSKIQDFMNSEMLKEKLLKIASRLKIAQIDGDSVAYLALAAQDRIRSLIESMVNASKHRTHNPFQTPPLTESGQPIFKIRVKQNIKNQLDAIEKAMKLAEDQMVVDDNDEDDDGREGWYSKKSQKPLCLSNHDGERKVTVQDAIFVMEHDAQGGRGTNQRTLLKTYNKWS